MPMIAIKYIAKSFSLLFGVIFLGGFLHFFVLELTEINGISMEPNFIDEQKVIVNKITPLFTPIKRGMVVSVFDEYNKLLLIKRVIGLPGEEVTIRNGRIFIRNAQGEEKRLTESYLRENVITQPKIGNEEIYAILGEHEYFILGDNRFRSTDSRVYGAVNRSQIVGTIHPTPFASLNK